VNSPRRRAAALLALLSLSPLLLSGCGYLFGDDGIFRDTKNDYKEAPELPQMQLPEGTRVAGQLQEIYPIPEVSNDDYATRGDKVPRPEPLLAASAEQMVRIQRLGDDSWALIAIPPGQLWPQVRSFMAAANIPIGRVDARSGLIESSYLELQNQELPARFRFRVERGVQRGNSELHVLQMFRSTDADGWPQRSDDLELEAEMLRSVAQFIANSADTAPVSMMAEQSIAATGKLQLIEEGDAAYLRLELPFDRAWASLARAIEDAGFTITDRDRSAGRYYARYTGVEDEDDGGWFSWFGDDDDENPLSGVPLLVTLEDQGDGVQEIHVAPEQPGADLAREDGMMALQMLKGNIN
jgi:outer membrane protein assembly factor BamC